MNTSGPEGVRYSEMFIIVRAIEMQYVKNRFPFFYHDSTCHYSFSSAHYTELFAIVSSVVVMFHCSLKMDICFLSASGVSSLKSPHLSSSSDTENIIDSNQSYTE